MKNRVYDPADAEALAPLLDSIGRELEERAARLAAIEARRLELDGAPRHDLWTVAELRNLEGEASSQRRELRHCREELERLGCSVVGTTPLTVRIPTRVGNADRSRVWQHGREPTDD